MGGLGSGQRPRKWSVEESLVIDVWELQQSRTLAPGVCGRLDYTDNRGGSNSLGYVIEGTPPRELVALYRVTRDGASEDVEEHIELERQPAGFGGHRYWLRCPRCHARRAKVYLSPGKTRFGCRGCYDLTHRTVQEHDARVDRLRADPVELARALNTRNARGLLLPMLAYRKGPLLCRRRRKPKDGEGGPSHGGGRGGSARARCIGAGGARG